MPITEYAVEYTPAGGSATVVSTGSTSTSYTQTGLTNSTAYTFKVAGVNTVGTGSYSTPSSSVTPIDGDAFYSDVALLLHADGTGGTFVDSSPYSRTITAEGGVTQSTSQSKFGGKSAYFSSSGDYLSVADADSVELSNSDFVLEFFMQTTNSTQYATLVSRSPSSYESGAWSLLMNSADSTSGDIALYAADIASPILQSSGVNLRDGSWHYVAVSRAGSNWSLYVDGTRVGTGTSSATVVALLPWWACAAIFSPGCSGVLKKGD
jgi:hypothetical protein